MIKKLFPTLDAWLFIMSVVIALTACTPPRFPLQITDLSATPEPVVGQTVTLYIEIMSTKDEPNTTIEVYLPEAVKLMDGDLVWQGSLTANQPQAHEVSVCVLFEGDWRVEVESRSYQSENDSYGDLETIHFISTAITGRSVPGSKYHYTQDPNRISPSTPFPDEPPPDVCP